jgi:hypothetical protein
MNGVRMVAKASTDVVGEHRHGNEFSINKQLKKRKHFC